MKKSVTFFLLLALVGLTPQNLVSQAKSNVQTGEPSKWVKAEVPLTVSHEILNREQGYASAEGFWQSTSSSDEKQLVSPIAVKLICLRSEKRCIEADASVEFGALKPEMVEYEVSSWTDNGIVADDSDEGVCGIGHRLSLDFKTNSVTVTDYPKKVNDGQLCKPFQDANSYALHGGNLVLSPAPKWEPLAKAVASK